MLEKTSITYEQGIIKKEDTMKFFQELAEQTAIVERLQEKFKFVVFDGDKKKEFKFKNIYNIYSFKGKKEFWESEKEITKLFKAKYLEAKQKIKSAIIDICISFCKENYLTLAEEEMRNTISPLISNKTDDLKDHSDDDTFYILCKTLKIAKPSELSDILKGDYHIYPDYLIDYEDEDYDDD